MIDLVLKNWRTLNETLTTLREDQVKELLDYEMANRKRKDMITRLHQRYTMLRAARERKELFGE